MARDDRDYRVDLSSNPTPAASKGPPAARPYLGVQFACCGIYARVYRTPGDTAYRARCPRCGKTANFPVGNGGTSDRFFIVQ